MYRINHELPAGSFNGKKLLITGSKGYIGSHLVNTLKDFDCEIIRVSQSEQAFPEVVDATAKIHDVKYELATQSSWDELLQDCDIVFHLAAQTSVYAANADPKDDFHQQLEPLLSLLESCRKNSYTPHIIFASSASVYGSAKQLPVNETFAYATLSMYELHKEIAEKYLSFYHQQYNLATTVLQLANVYGPGRRPSANDRGVLNTMILKALRQELLTIHGKGEFLRDYVYIDDVIRAFLFAALNKEQVRGERYIISSGLAHTVSEAINIVANKVGALTNKQIQVESITPPNNQSPVELRNFCGDSNKFMQATNWQANFNLSQGVDKTIATYLQAELF